MRNIENDSFMEFVRDQLQNLGNVSIRRMFGGYGIYAGTRFFGILHKGRLYFKTDAQTRGRYLERDMSALRATAKLLLTNYYEVPIDVVEDPETLIEWAKLSVAVAGAGRIRTATARRRRKKR